MAEIKSENIHTVGDLIKGLEQYSPETYVNIFNQSTEEDSCINGLLDQETDPPQVDIRINEEVPDYYGEDMNEIYQKILDWKVSQISRESNPFFGNSVKKLIFEILKIVKPDSIGSDSNMQLVHCLKCDDVFIEQKIQIKVCPYCGNEDMNQTVYLQGDETPTWHQGHEPQMGSYDH